MTKSTLGLFFIPLFFSNVFAADIPADGSFGFVSKAGDSVVLSKTTGDMSQEKLVFTAAFQVAYKDFPAEEFAPGSLADLLEQGFAKEIAAFKANRSDCLFVSAKIGNTVVGYTSFEMQGDGTTVYIRQCAVLPHYSGRWIGQNLIFSVRHFWPDIKKLTLVTRKRNAAAIGFYQRIGFVPSPCSHEGHGDKYTGLEFNFIA
jgi:ribosomal protein S18 acetylase RimI-like enzyme